MSTLKIDRVLVGEALVGDGNEVAHIDLIMGPRGSAAETAFCTTLTNQKVGDNALLALVRPKSDDEAGDRDVQQSRHQERRSGW